MKRLIVIPPRDNGYYVTREIGDAIYNRPPFNLNPYGAVVYATKMREEEGEKVEILDAQTLGLSYEQTKKLVQKKNPDIITYFIGVYGIPYDVQCVDWKCQKEFVVSPIRVDVNELIEIYAEELPFEKEDFITNPDYFIGKADFSLIDLTKYVTPVRINTNDFCPYQCTFCCRSGMRARLKPVEDTIEEVDYIIKKFGIREFFFFGSEISIKKDAALQLAEKLSSRNIKFWALDRADLVEEDVYSELVKAGMTNVHFGVESGSQKCLDYVKKGIKPEDSIEAFQKIRKFKKLIKRAYFIVGFPIEELSDVLSSIWLSWKLAPNESYVETLYPEPASTLYKQLKTEGKLLTRRWEVYKHYNRRALVFKTNRYKNYKQLKRTRDVTELLMLLRNSKTKILTKLIRKISQNILGRVI